MSEAEERRAEENEPVAGASAASTTAAINGHTGNDTEEGYFCDVKHKTWISWYCSLKRNAFFCEVDKAFIIDSDNLFGLSEVVPHYKQALHLILTFEDFHADTFFQRQDDSIKSAAEKLYGLIHARYILTTEGMDKMQSKFTANDFATCPRLHCNGQQCLPVGESDIHHYSEVKIYCPKCEEMYMSPYHMNPDGAYFGTTFPHVFLMRYKEFKPVEASERYVPRVFGFKIHKPQGNN